MEGRKEGRKEGKVERSELKGKTVKEERVAKEGTL